MPDETPWHTSLEEDLRNTAVSKGWDKLPLAGAVTEAMKSYRELEKHIGVPADRLLKLPDAADQEGWKAIHRRLGVPAEGAGYDFTGVKHSDGSAVEEPFLVFMRDAALRLNISKDSAGALASEFIKFGEKSDADAAIRDRAAVAIAHDALKQSWGAQADTNKFIADRAASLLGLGPEVLNTLAASSSYGAVMEGLRKVGVAMGEAALVGQGSTAPGQRIMTREEATARKAELIADRDWVARWGKGEKAAVDEINNLDRLIVGAPR